MPLLGFVAETATQRKCDRAQTSAGNIVESLRGSQKCSVQTETIITLSVGASDDDG
jgi:hypothetical protein